MIWKNHDYVRNTRNKISRLKGFTIINMMRTYVICFKDPSIHGLYKRFSCLKENGMCTCFLHKKYKNFVTYMNTIVDHKQLVLEWTNSSTKCIS